MVAATCRIAGTIGGRLLSAAGLLLALPTCGQAQEPTVQYSLGFIYGHDCCAVSHR